MRINIVLDDRVVFLRVRPLHADTPLPPASTGTRGVVDPQPVTIDRLESAASAAAAGGPLPMKMLLKKRLSPPLMLVRPATSVE